MICKRCQIVISEERGGDLDVLCSQCAETPFQERCDSCDGVGDGVTISEGSPYEVRVCSRCLVELKELILKLV